MIAMIYYFLTLFCCVLSAAEERWVVAGHGMNVAFDSWQSDDAKAAAILVLISGYNGSGKEMLDLRWKEFAEKNALILLAPSFQAEGFENTWGEGYYYPEQGSGGVLEMALNELTRRTGVNSDAVLLFGFSAGAHFAHRFALWKPQRVKAFAAYSAGWWSEPTEAVRRVPALIMCGEADPRYAATFEFFKMGQHLGCPWVWRSYTHTGHELTSSVRNMAEAFLGHFAFRKEPSEMPALCYGDIQTFKSVPLAEKEVIPEEFRIELPSQAVADVWEKETE